MQKMMFLLMGLAVGAAFLALYERRKNRHLKLDEGSDPHRAPARAAYTKSEVIRTEASIANPPQGRGIF